jgi:hypothetical protein
MISAQDADVEARPLIPDLKGEAMEAHDRRNKAQADAVARDR